MKGMRLRCKVGVEAQEVPKDSRKETQVEKQRRKLSRYDEYKRVQWKSWETPKEAIGKAVL